MASRCCATTREGNPCSAQARPGSVHCAWHDPELSQRRAEWSQKGGAQRSNKARAKRQLLDGALTAGEVGAVLSAVLKGVVAGKIEPGVANAAANVARALADVRKVGDLETEVEELTRLVRAGRAS